MANNIYKIDLLQTGTTTLTINDDGTGIDWLVYENGYSTYSEITLSWVAVSGVATSAEGMYFNPSNVGHRLIVNGVIENARGGTAEDWITGNELDNVLMGDRTDTGTGGNDTINGAAGFDTIRGGSGRDSVFGGADDDLIYGHAGNDTLNGDGGADTIQGGLGADNLSGGASARDTVSYTASSAGVRIDITFGSTTTGTGGDATNDKINGFTDVIGSAYGDVIRDTVSNTIAFGYNANRFWGGGASDTLILGGGNDTGYGGSGTDFLYGGLGDDSLYGGSESDYLTGNSGLDRLSGGLGADRFIYRAASDSTATASARDVVYDFDRAEGDKIDLRNIDTSTALGDQAFTFRGALAYNGVKGALIVRATSSGNTLVSADMGGDLDSDFSILVLGTTSMIGSDFLL